MKKKYLFVLVMLFVLAFTFSSSSADSTEHNNAITLELPGNIAEAKLPASLEIIEDEAFEGTALVKIELPEGVETLGERAFANIFTLREVRMPLATKHIASTTFEDSYRTTITAPTNSYARAYARNQGIPFSPIIMVCALAQGTTVSTLTVNRSKEDVEIVDGSEFKPETEWYKNVEINILRTEELIAYHVQGRSPPMA